MPSLADVYNSELEIVDLTQLLVKLHREGPLHMEVLEFLAHMKLERPAQFTAIEKQLMYLLGMFYKTSEPITFLEEAYSLFSNTIEESTGHKYTPVQASIFKNIRDKKYYSFSAPTSAGKSHLFRDLISNESGDIVIVLPSRALIAEYMYKVLEIVKDDHSVLVLQFIEDINRQNTQRRIYIITPERGVELFKHISNLNISLFLFDEAQISENGIRGLRFDAFVRRVDRLLPNSKKVFAHPFIANPEAQLKKHQFNSDSSSMCFRQTSVGKVFVSRTDDGFKLFSPNEKYFQKDLPSDYFKNILNNGGSFYIYTSKDKLYSGNYLTDFADYINVCPQITNPQALDIIQTLKDYIGATDNDKVSNLIRMMNRGIVLHHGSMPLKARLLVEQFINEGFASICFATATLIQGVNMPFDTVWIDNFRFDGSENDKSLLIQNLIGRAGRTTNSINNFDYGYVVVNKKNIETFKERVLTFPVLSESSNLDNDINDLDDDYIDIAEAIRNDNFDDDLQLTNEQVDRLSSSDVEKNIKYILNKLMKDGEPVTARDYYALSGSVRNRVKASFGEIFVSHLRRTAITKAEKTVLSASLPILLWRIQGKSFKEILSLRHSYLSRKQELNSILTKVKNNEISAEEGQKEISELKIKLTPIAFPLPNSKATIGWLFDNTHINNLDYDKLVYVTFSP